MSHSPKPMIVPKIVMSHHSPPNIIENYNGSITPVHILMTRQSNLQPHIIPPKYQQPIRMEKQQHLASPRVPIITQPTTVLTSRVPMLRHQYHIRPRRQVAYSCTQTGKFLLAFNTITAMEANAVVHQVTRVYQE